MSDRGEATVAAEICAACDGISIEPRGFCPVCGSRDIRPGAIAGRGAIWSVTPIHRPPSSDGPPIEPYGIAVIALAAGPRLMARVANGVAIGDPVRVHRPGIADPTTTVISSVD